MVELLINHVTALRRDVEERRTSAGTVQVGVYRSIRPEHLAHAMVYLQTAIDLDKAGRTRVDVITDAPADEAEQTIHDIAIDIYKGITNLLAEVPASQLEDYLKRWEQADYQPPFPLSYKLDCVMKDGYRLEDIRKVMEDLIQDHMRKAA